MICLRWPKCLNAIVLADVDLSYWTSQVEHIAAFTAIFSNIFTAHAQKRLFMNFRCKFRHRRSIRRPRFPVRVQNRCTRLGCSLSQETKKSSRVTRGAKSRMRRTETPKPILIKFCVVVDIPDVVTNFGDHRLRGFWVAGGQISPSPIDFHRRRYNTLALPCECVMFYSTGDACTFDICY